MSLTKCCTTSHLLPGKWSNRSDDIQSKTSIEVGLLAITWFRQSSPGWLPQVTACWNKLLHLMLGPFFFSFVNCLEKTELIFQKFNRLEKQIALLYADRDRHLTFLKYMCALFETSNGMNASIMQCLYCLTKLMMVSMKTTSLSYQLFLLQSIRNIRSL
jgi:hypothetical protein